MGAQMLRPTRGARVVVFFMGAVSATACVGTPGSEDIQAAANERGLATCDGNWHWVGVAGTKCLNGTATGFEYKCPVGHSQSNPLVMYLDAGNACWDYDSCFCPNHDCGLCQDPPANTICPLI